jgi:hypothetical protein
MFEKLPPVMSVQLLPAFFIEQSYLAVNYLTLEPLGLFALADRDSQNE